MYHQIHTHLCIRHGVQTRIIYISVVNFFLIFIFILGFLDLSTLIQSFSQQLKELGWGFFFLEILFRILEIFNIFYIAIIFYYSSMDARTSSR